jgi:DMSO/TMAO reductase YedYZ heme-binding membrane subunit
MGIIGFYLLIIIILTSLILIVTKYKAWRLIHYLTYPTFVFLFIHGLFIGTDSSALAMKLVYLITGSLAAIAFAYRLSKALSRKLSK